MQVPLSTSAESHPPLVSFLTPVDILHATYVSYLVFISFLTILCYFNLLIEINSSKVVFLKWKRKKKKHLSKQSKMNFVLLKLFHIKGFWWVVLSFDSISRIPGCSMKCSGTWRWPWTSDLLAVPPRALITEVWHHAQFMLCWNWAPAAIALEKQLLLSSIPAPWLRVFFICEHNVSPGF